VSLTALQQRIQKAFDCRGTEPGAQTHQHSEPEPEPTGRIKAHTRRNAAFILLPVVAVVVCIAIHDNAGRGSETAAGLVVRKNSAMAQFDSGRRLILKNFFYRQFMRRRALSFDHAN
jgi:hypothetical protein